ncbi:MAG: thrombospondin type 3 repeat-containing protein, partial [Halobacteriales archaeon]|nr:thrombospondin type 3 repeat-containing protein [Halobacteriales archaeon]
PPIPDFSVDASRADCVASQVLFADASVDYDGALTSWAWTFGDGAATSADLAPSHTYSQAGTYAVTLTVQDTNGFTRSATRQVTSVGDPDCCPVIAPLDGWTVREGETVAFAATATDPEGAGAVFRLVGDRATAAAMDDSGAFSWLTRHGDAGTHLFHVWVGDAAHAAPGSLGCDEAQFRVNVVAAPPPGATEPIIDTDMDGIQDHADLCPSVPDHEQVDTDSDGQGDACDGRAPGAPLPAAVLERRRALRDRDGDGVLDALDDCPDRADNDQLDLDRDGQGDACDADVDGDGVVDATDDCPMVPDARQDCAAMAARRPLLPAVGATATVQHSLAGPLVAVAAFAATGFLVAFVVLRRRSE